MYLRRVSRFVTSGFRSLTGIMRPAYGLAEDESCPDEKRLLHERTPDQVLSMDDTDDGGFLLPDEPASAATE